MTTSRALQCPVCRIPLTELSVEGTSIFLPVCSGCGGTWLDIARSQRVVRGLISQAERALAAHASSAAAPPPRGLGGDTPHPGLGGETPHPGQAPAESVRSCPDCGAPLAQTVVTDLRITLDACSAHGTWFDARELTAVADTFALKAASDDADAVQFGKELADARRKEVAGGTGFAARFLSRFLR